VGGALNGRAAGQSKNKREHKETENTHRFSDCETHNVQIEGRAAFGASLSNAGLDVNTSIN